MRFNPALATDFYKTGHIKQYPEGTEFVYSNFTCRSDRHAAVLPDFDHKTVFFGLQGVIQWLLMETWPRDFFGRPLRQILREYDETMETGLGQGAVDSSHIAALHNLGYLPLLIKALPEGSRVDLRVPLFTITNTHPDFAWLVNYLEDQFSSECWKMITTATVAHEFRRMLDNYAEMTGADPDFVPWQGHDFSMRGMSGVVDATQSGAAHLLSFYGTDTVTALQYLKQYYAGHGLIGGSVPATEHSVMCMGGEDDEEETIRRLICETYPNGIISIVSDTWDFWSVIGSTTQVLYDEIMARDGKVVFRPDSGDPVKIICGDPDSAHSEPKMGAVELLWEIFGGTVNAKGYKVLDPHVGLIYGDSITLPIAWDILKGLKAKGFATSNIVFGIGSYCVAPDVPILCSDLTWRKAGDIPVGQEIIAFNEEERFGNGSPARRYLPATITANTLAYKPCFRISTDLGDDIIASEDHPWLVWSERRNGENRTIAPSDHNPDAPRGPGLAWRRTKDLTSDDQIAFLGRPWQEETTREAGWLAGIFDGEGSISRLRPDEHNPHFKVNISQNEGAVLQRIRDGLIARGFSFYENSRACPQLVLTGGWYELLRFLGQVRPERLLEKLPLIVSGMPFLSRDRTYRLARVTSLESVGLHPVASITTSEGTFVTGGYLSHNTYQHCTRDTFGTAIKATYGIVNGEPRELFKKPKTDNGTKQSARGLLRVKYENGHYVLHERQTPLQEQEGLLEPVFKNGELLRRQTLADIRKRLRDT